MRLPAHQDYVSEAIRHNLKNTPNIFFQTIGESMTVINELKRPALAEFVVICSKHKLLIHHCSKYSEDEEMSI